MTPTLVLHIAAGGAAVLTALFVLALAPLVLLLYWMWRVRLRRSLRGLQVMRGAGTAPAIAR